jgi:hypothetical protein
VQVTPTQSMATQRPSAQAALSAQTTPLQDWEMHLPSSAQTCPLSQLTPAQPVGTHTPLMQTSAGPQVALAQSRG